MKKTYFVLLALVAMTFWSCSSNDTSFSKTGLKFLEKAFSSAQIDAKQMLSNELNFGWDDSEDLLGYINELKWELPGMNLPEFEYQGGYSFHGFLGDKYGIGYYSYNEKKDHLIVLGFEKDSDTGEWLVDDIEIDRLEDLIDEYKAEIKDLEENIQKNDEESIKESKAIVKSIEKIIESLKDSFSESQYQKYEEIKSGK